MGREERKTEREQAKAERDAKQEARKDERQAGRPGAPGEPEGPPQVDILFDYVPMSGQVDKGTGTFTAGEVKTWGWRTPASGIVDDGANGKIGFTPSSDNNDKFTVVWDVAEDHEKSVNGPNGVIWQFGSGSTYNVPMKPDTNYEGTITAKYGGYALTLNLTAK